MAVLPSIKGIRREDLGNNDLPEWIDNLLSPITTFMESIYNAFNKNLTFTQNIACNIFTIQYTTDSAYSGGTFPTITFPRGIKTPAIGCLVLSVKNLTSPYSNFTSGISPTWYDNNGTITLTYISGLANSTKYEFKFLII